MIDPVLLEMLPPLRRARGDRLYGGNQQHWVDLWKQDGIWLLGRRPEGAAKEWKNQVDKGLSGLAPSLWPRRLEPLVRQLLPGITAVRVFRNADRAEAFLGAASVAECLWRPWAEASVPDPLGVVWPVLPTGPGQAVALAFGSRWTADLPAHDVVSPAEAAGLVHAAAEVIRFTADAHAILARTQVAAAFDRNLGPAGIFRRHGSWFETLVSPGDYPSLFKAHLDAGFLINPDPLGWGILPSTLSDGEWVAWKKVAETWKENRS